MHQVVVLYYCRAETVLVWYLVLSLDYPLVMVVFSIRICFLLDTLTGD